MISNFALCLFLAFVFMSRDVHSSPATTELQILNSLSFDSIQFTLTSIGDERGAVDYSRGGNSELRKRADVEFQAERSVPPSSVLFTFLVVPPHQFALFNLTVWAASKPTPAAMSLVLNITDGADSVLVLSAVPDSAAFRSQRILLNMTEIPLDNARYYVVDFTGPESSKVPTDLQLNFTSTDCYHCLSQRVYPALLETDGLTSVIPICEIPDCSFFIETNYVNDYEVIINNSIQAHFSHYAHDSEQVFIVIGHSESNSSGNVTVGTYLIRKITRSFWMPLVFAAVIMVGLCFLWIIGNYAYAHYLKQQQQQPANQPAQLLSESASIPTFSESSSIAISTSNNSRAAESVAESKPVGGAWRLLSLDVVRGISIFVMIFVNYGGGSYWFFDHSTWDGLTFADLVFPWFIWIMGASMAFSFKNIKITDRHSFFDNLFKIVRRTIILMWLGFFSSNRNRVMSDFRFPGVLQRFAISYFVVSIIIVFIPTRQSPPEEKDRKSVAEDRVGLINSTSKPQASSPSLFADITPYPFQWTGALLFLIAYFMLTYLVEVPGCGRGYIGPGGIGDYGMYRNCTGGAHGYIDRTFFTSTHIYQYPTAHWVYQTVVPYDPEGIVGAFTSIFLTFLGVQTGRIFVHYKGSHANILARLCFWGAFYGLLGTALCFGSKFGGVIPINKNLWSPSFIFVMAGTGNLLLALCYILVDIYQLWGGAPFLWFGMNPILLYCGHEVLHDFFPFSWRLVDPNSHAKLLALHLNGVGWWCLVAFKLYVDEFFVKI